MTSYSNSCAFAERINCFSETALSLWTIFTMQNQIILDLQTAKKSPFLFEKSYLSLKKISEYENLRVLDL